jgi:hypothetical protein
VFQNLLAKDKTGPIIERFLQKMLDLHDSRIHLCLLEKEMRKTNPTLLEEVIKSKPKNTSKHIYSNLLFLQSIAEVQIIVLS